MESTQRPANSDAAELLTAAEARELLAMSQSAFSRLVVAETLTPAMRAGRGRRAAMLFRRVDVEALAAERAVR